MKLEDLIKAFADAGLGEDEIKQALAQLKEEIDAYIGGAEKEEAPCEECDDEEKYKEIFG